MPRYDFHRQQAEKFDLSKDVIQYVNKAIDAKNLKQMPEDFQSHNKEKKIEMAKLQKLSIADLVSNFHDRGKNDVNMSTWKEIQRLDLKFLLEKGKNYVEAYYLHFILDYLNDNKDMIKNTSETVEDYLKKFRNRRKVTISETEKIFEEVMNFLENRLNDLKKDFEIYLLQKKK